MLPVTPVPASPTALDPLLMPRRGPAPQSLGVPVTGVRVLLLGLCPVTAAAAVMLAGCGVRGFTVVDDGWVTWEAARAGAFDSTEVGMPADLCLRRRIRTANAEAAPVTWTDDVLSDARPGRVVLRASRARALPGVGAQPGEGKNGRSADGPGAGVSVDAGDGSGLDSGASTRAPHRAAPSDDAHAAPEPIMHVSAPGDHLGLPGGVPLVEVLRLPGTSGAVVLSADGTWGDRRCPQCQSDAAAWALSRLAEASPTAPRSAAVRASAPAHTAWCAAAVVQAVLGAALEPPMPAGAAGPKASPEPEPSAGARALGLGSRVLAPGRPFGLSLSGPPRSGSCPLCAG